MTTNPKRDALGDRFSRAKASNTSSLMDRPSDDAVRAASETANDAASDAARFDGIDNSRVQGIIKDHAPKSLRRPEYKGKRKQVAFRLTMEPLKAVKLVMELRRGEGGAFFEKALHDAALAELERLQGEIEPLEYEAAEKRVTDAIK